MRTATVQTNQTCDYRCRFCTARRDRERVELAGPAAVKAAVDDAIATGAPTLILSGGEPTLRRDLAAIVSYARRAGAAEVVLETHGGQLTDRRVAQLSTAGLGAARVMLPGWGEHADAITGVTGSFAAARAGLAALARAGVALELALPVVAGNADRVAELPSALVEAGLAPRLLHIVVPIEAPAPDALAPIPQATAAVAALAAAARQAGLEAKLSPLSFLPPCAFADPGGVAELYSLTSHAPDRADCRREPGCADCAVADRCPGVAEPLRRAGFAVAPLASDRIRRRLSNIGTVREQVERELVTRELYRREDGRVTWAHTIRIDFRCNQTCRFCFVSTHLPRPPAETVRAAIASAAAGGGTVALSGGEPTLDPSLLDYVTLARSSGAGAIELQTNAVRLGQGDLASRLVEAGVSQVLVSLHGSTAAISDAITGVPGSHEQTVRGIDALIATGVRVRLNFVFCQLNRGDFARYVDLVASRWPGVSLTLSFIAASTDLVPQRRDLVPRYSEILPDLAAGLARARAAAIEVTGLDSMCGIPLCLVPAEVADYFSLAAVPEGFDRGEFVRAEPCRRCALHGRCFGLRRGYAELYGSSELVPVSDPGHGGSGTTTRS